MAARTPLTPTTLTPGQVGVDAVEATTPIDAANGMIIQTSSVVRHVLLRVTNTHSSPHAVTIVSPPAKGNPRAVYGAVPGPAGSSPSEPDLVTSPIAASTGIRYIAVGSRYFGVDNSILVNFEAAHVGVIQALEIA